VAANKRPSNSTKTIGFGAERTGELLVDARFKQKIDRKPQERGDNQAEKGLTEAKEERGREQWSLS
jgi:hypothetical protein